MKEKYSIKVFMLVDGDEPIEPAGRMIRSEELFVRVISTNNGEKVYTMREFEILFTDLMMKSKKFDAILNYIQALEKGSENYGFDK